MINIYYTKRNDLSYTVNYIDKGTDKVLDTKTVGNQTFGTVIKSENEKITIDGYNYDSLSPETLEIGTSDNVINIYYTKRNDLSYTVNYLEKDTNKVLHAPKTKDGMTFEAVVNSADEVIEIDGYNYDSVKPEEKLTIGTGENVLNLYYTKRTDLSYTVNYYWNGTTEKVAESKTVNNQTFEAEVTEYPVAVEGYTPVSEKSKTITIGTETNEINFYYYKNVKLTANSDTKTYNGQEQSVSGYTCAVEEKQQDGSMEYVPWTGEKPLTFEGVSASGSGKDVNKKGYPVTFNETPIGKNDGLYYVNESQTGTLTITPRAVTLTSASDEKVYDGKPLTNETVAVGGDGFADGEGATYDFTGSQTDVGESKNVFTFEVNKGTNPKNYTFEVAIGKLKVTPVTEEVIVTITGRTDEMPYDGKEHSVFGYDVTVSNALYNPKEDMQFNGTDVDMTAKGTDAGTYPMKLTAEHFTNKSNNFTNVTFVVTDGYVKINPRAVKLTSETAGKTYDGTALEKPVVTVGGDGFVEGQVKEIKATGSVTNAGSVANTITFTPDKETFKDGNYAITMNEGSLTVTKRSVLLTSQSATKTYDGSALTRPAVTITGDGFVPGELAKAEATGSITKVGSTPNTIRYTTTGAFNAANYSIALSVGTLTVTEKPKPEPRRTFNLTINYVYQNGKRAAASYNRGGLKNGETFDITSPVIAGYTASETVVSGTIYNRDIKVTVIYTADGVNLDDYGVPLGLGNITMNVGDCFE